MFSGIKYAGLVSGRVFGRHSTSGGPERVGGYILSDTQGDGWRMRLDALDIKSWQVGS
jgi:hypothetical protein